MRRFLYYLAWRDAEASALFWKRLCHWLVTRAELTRIRRLRRMVGASHGRKSL
jgi:hypothetical protein